MAPNSSYKKHVKFAKSRSPVPHKKITSSADSYANIVLHYLSKLKSMFSSSHKFNTGVSSQDSYDNISKPILKKMPQSSGYSDTDLKSKQKVYDIVNAALQYGCANDIIEKVGNYFLVKTKSTDSFNVRRRRQPSAGRRPTPGPDYIRCAGCKNLAKSSKHMSKVRKRYDGYDYRNSSSWNRGSSKSSLTNYCSKCYSRMKNKRYK